jgi:hypothetical protein
MAENGREEDEEAASKQPQQAGHSQLGEQRSQLLSRSLRLQLRRKRLDSKHRLRAEQWRQLPHQHH